MDIADFYLNFIKINKDVEKKIYKKIFKHILAVAFQINNSNSSLDEKIKKNIESDINIIYLRKNLQKNIN